MAVELFEGPMRVELTQVDTEEDCSEMVLFAGAQIQIELHGLGPDLL
jgi:hypothetical protein